MGGIVKADRIRGVRCVYDASETVTQCYYLPSPSTCHEWFVSRTWQRAGLEVSLKCVTLAVGNGWSLIGSPYSALEPISASRMMPTSLNAYRQSQLSPFIQTSSGPTRSLPPLCTRKHTYSTRKWVGLCAFSPPFLCSSAVLSSITPPIKVCKVERRCANTHAPLFACSLAFFLAPAHLPLISTKMVDIGHFCISGQLHQIQKDIRGHPAAILRVTMRWRAQWKAVMNVGSGSRLSSTLPRKAVHRSQPWRWKQQQEAPRT